MIKPFFDSPLPRVFAHRGFAAPQSATVENTIPAFRAALELGATYLETDVHASSDGVAVISHDADLSRLISVKEQVSDHSLADLRAMDVGGGATFSSLAEALDAFPTARFNIDIKSADAVGPTVDAVRTMGASDRVLCTSFSETRRMGVVRALPGVATSASAARFLRALLAGRLGLTNVVTSALATVDAVQVPERALRLEVTTERFIDQLHQAGVEIHVWTINDADTMNRLLDRGVDGIITDRADIAMSVLAQRS
ncbi:glycerophosphodiester phosphodiesterase [soil metagenome]